MAKNGQAKRSGSGESRINPIHGKVLAEVWVDTLLSAEHEIEVGGPQTFTRRQIAELAFDVLHKSENSSCKLFVEARIIKMDRPMLMKLMEDHFLTRRRI